ncbi:MAG TPA: hypothetical protein VF173_35695 [Thermoanaerobaculia bacterium]|nr:hypothetical protein [Thermoanaerobaculia bacterium]
MEPQSPPPPVSPFNPAPQAAAPQGGRGGCSKPLIVGCVVIFLVGAIALLGGLYYVGTHAAAILQWSLTQMETGLLAQLPKDVTPQEKDRLQQAFAAVREGAKNGTIPPDRLQPLQFRVLEITRKGANVTRQDILDFTRALEETAGKPHEPNSPGATPTTAAPAPEGSPGPAGRP